MIRRLSLFSPGSLSYSPSASVIGAADLFEVLPQGAGWCVVVVFRCFRGLSSSSAARTDLVLTLVFCQVANKLKCQPLIVTHWVIFRKKEVSTKTENKRLWKNKRGWEVTGWQVLAGRFLDMLVICGSRARQKRGRNAWEFLGADCTSVLTGFRSDFSIPFS